MKKLFIAISTMLFAACAPKYPTVTPDEFEQTIAALLFALQDLTSLDA